MSVYQRGDGRWVCKVKDTSRRPAKWVQRTFRTKEEADEFNDEATQEERQSARLTVYEAVGLYLNDHALSPWVESQYRWLVGGTSSPHAKKLNICKINNLTQLSHHACTTAAPQPQSRPEPPLHLASPLRRGAFFVTSDSFCRVFR